MFFLTRKAKGLFRRILKFSRNLQYALLSTNERVEGRPTKYQPILAMGKGKIYFENDVKIGVPPSPGFWSSYCYIESRYPTAEICIGENSWINNGFSAIAEKCSIKIGRNCLIGHEVVILDSDFHSLDPKERHKINEHVETGNVIISDNVFIGSRAVILKNSMIGTGCVIGAGAVVSGVFPSNSLIAGNPAKIIRYL